MCPAWLRPDCSESAAPGIRLFWAAHRRRIAARMLEAAPEDIVFRDGHFSVTGTDRGVTPTARHG
jgi:hypothetical protein